MAGNFAASPACSSSFSTPSRSSSGSSSAQPSPAPSPGSVGPESGCILFKQPELLQEWKNQWLEANNIMLRVQTPSANIESMRAFAIKKFTVHMMSQLPNYAATSLDYGPFFQQAILTSMYWSQEQEKFAKAFANDICVDITSRAMAYSNPVM